MAHESPWPPANWICGPGSSGGSKRKRPNSGICSGIISFSQEVDALSSSPVESGFNTESQTSPGAMFLRGVAEEACFPTNLGLGLTALANSEEIADGCFTSLISGGRSVLTSANSGGHLYNTLSPGENMPQGFVVGSKPSGSDLIESHGREDLDSRNVDPTMHELGMQLQLGISGSSPVTVADADFMPRGVAQFALGQGGTYEDARNETLPCGSIPIIDEGSTSARLIKAGGYIPSLLMGRRLDCLPSFDIEKHSRQSAEGKNGNTFHDHSAETGMDLMNKDAASQNDILLNFRTSSGTTSTSLPSAGLERAPKTCKFRGCSKGARGASGLCIIHGGGRRCQRQGCNKGAEGSTVYCKTHGGGRRCQSLGCTKSAEGKTDYCISHGGGRRCSHDGCTKAARGRSGLCIRHGGGKRCQKEGCTKSAEGYSGLCISHGGGRRCQYEGCKKGAQGSTMFCKAHGGGKRCMIQGCNKGAEGSTPLCKGHGGGKRCMFEGGGICTKSVHGGTSFCVAHGGGKRCAVKDCTKSARGRTDFCVRHGGGKRCKVENCTKSAQGSTDFCKAHGGGKRCSWGQAGSPYSEFVKDKTGDLFKGPCERFARGKLGLCAAHSALVQDRRVHGSGMIGSTLSSGIGPGLFRGLVEGSMQAVKRTELADDTGQLSIYSRNGLGDVTPESINSELLMYAGARSTEGESVGKQDETHRLPSHALGCTSGLTFHGSNLVEKAWSPVDKVDGGSGVPTNHSIGLLSALSMPGQIDGDTPANLEFGRIVASTHGAPNDNMLRGSMAGLDMSFHCPILPPQVLVPLSMRNTDFFSEDRETQSSGSRNNRSDGFFKVTSLCPPQQMEIDQRVHGGNVLVSLTGRGVGFGTPVDN